MKKIDGNELLYHFFQKCWLEEDPDAAHGFIKKAIDTLGIWMHPNYYTELPIFVPYAVRDASCRSSGPNGDDEWGSPDKDGYFRDDNSLIKGIVKSLKVESRSKWLRGGKGNGFTASHVWREPADYAETNILASRRPDLNSFVPNLVWLPKQIAKLTDREGSFAQHYLQILSRHIYSDVYVKPSARNLMDSLWRALPNPTGLDHLALPEKRDIAFFEYKDSIVKGRKRNQIVGVSNACENILRTGRMPDMKIISQRYTQKLHMVDRMSLMRLKTWIDNYLSAVSDV